MVGFPLAVYVLLYYNCPLRRVQLTILHGNSILSYHAGVVELADSTDLGSVTFMVCGFDSRRPHHRSILRDTPIFFISKIILKKVVQKHAAFCLFPPIL